MAVTGDGCKGSTYQESKGAMKIRHLKKRKMALFYKHRSFLWSAQKLQLKIFDVYSKFEKQFSEIYMKEKNT